MKGTYCLLIELAGDANIKIGALGRIYFRRGKYVYVGSALNGLEGRIRRHLTRKKKKHWHIDYFLANKNAMLRRVYANASGKRLECSVARKVAGQGTRIKGFGCSDCGCESHFFRVKKFIPPRGFKEFEARA